MKEEVISAGAPGLTVAAFVARVSVPTVIRTRYSVIEAINMQPDGSIQVAQFRPQVRMLEVPSW